MRCKLFQLRGVISGCVLSLIVTTIPSDTLAQSTSSTLNTVFACAASSNIDVNANLRSSIEDILKTESATGYAKIKNDSGFLAFIQQLPPADRLKAYELYLKCIKETINPHSEDIVQKQQAFLLRFGDTTTFKSVVQTFGEPEEEITLLGKDFHNGKNIRDKITFYRFETASESVGLYLIVNGKKEPIAVAISRLEYGERNVSTIPFLRLAFLNRERPRMIRTMIRISTLCRTCKR